MTLVCSIFLYYYPFEESLTSTLIEIQIALFVFVFVLKGKIIKYKV